MERLRSKEGCPWDRAQTHQSLRSCLIEEAYEVLDAIDKNDYKLLKEELGDLLLQVIFHSTIAKQNNEFELEDVIDGICKKIIYRHPHVFEQKKANDKTQAMQSWESQKNKEKNYKTTSESMKNIPKDLPALMKANKIQKKAKDVGFDWDNIDDVVKKIEEEKNELIQAKQKNDKENIKEEAGDLLFSVVNLVRFLDVEPETALNDTCKKFINRFSEVENRINKKGKSMKDMDLESLDSVWDDVKGKK